MDSSKVEDDDSELLFNSPEPPASTGKTEGAPQQYKESRYSTAEAREVALKQELQNIRKINQVVEGVVESLEKAKSNMDTVSRTVNSASTLLHTWTRILSQAEHNQKLILNPRWQGASQDLLNIENEEIRRRQDAQRKQIEEQQRKEAAARRAEEEERRKAATTATRGARGARGGSRVSTRPTSGASGSTTTSGYGRLGAAGTRGSRAGSSASRASSTTGRARATRGRGLG